MFFYNYIKNFDTLEKKNFKYEHLPKGTRLLFQITTRGNNETVVQKSINKINTICEEINFTDYSVEVVKWE